MSMTDPLGDMLTRIRNGLTAKKSVVECPKSKLRASVLEVLKKEGYIRGFEFKKNAENKDVILIELKYFEGAPVIKELKRISKPGLRQYSNKKEIPEINGGLGIAIVSTNKGLMTDQEAKEAGLGGELICSVF